MKLGDRVRITTKNGLAFQGVLLEGTQYTLKLDDGYNVGIAPRNVESSEVLEHTKKSSQNPPSVKQDDSLPHITLLHTGGTIASKVDYKTGGVTNKITPKELLAMYPELSTFAHITPHFVSQMSSDDMRFAHYNKLIRAVHQAVKSGAQGVIITHGTDTLHYTAAALHYALLGVPIPVVLVGSQRSADRGSTDAATNLLGATQFITSLACPGVYIAMHGSSSDDDIAILCGINARKNHSSARDAFSSLNLALVARITKGNTALISELQKSTQPFSPTFFNTDLKVGMVYVHPQFCADALAPFKKYDGLVVLGTGLGHAPINTLDEHTAHHAEIKKSLTELAKKLPVVMTTQCLSGRVNLQVYSPGRTLQDAGVLGHDLALTPETVFAKLSFLLSQQLSSQEVATQLTEDYGDAIDRTEYAAK